MKSSIALVAFGGLFVLASCKESTTSNTGSSAESEKGKSTAAVDPEVAGYLLFDSSKTLPVGTVRTETEVMTMKDCKLTMEMQGQKMDGSMTRVGEKVSVYTVDSDDKITMKVEKSASEGSMVMMGQQQNQPKELDELHEKTVVFTKTDGVWTGKLDGGEATEKQQEKIEKIAKKINGDGDSKHIYGTERRKVGDSWDADTSKITSFGDDGQKLSGTFKVTFEGVETFKDQKCAVLVADVDLTSPTGEGDMVMKVKGKFRIHRSLEHLVDLENEMEGTVTMNGTINQGAGKMTVEGPMTMSEKTELKLP
ncbi:hypothetical protein [Oceaniferula spumae]